MSHGPWTVASHAFANTQIHLSAIQNSGNNVISQDAPIYHITIIR